MHAGIEMLGNRRIGADAMHFHHVKQACDGERPRRFRGLVVQLRRGSSQNRTLREIRHITIQQQGGCIYGKNLQPSLVQLSPVLHSELAAERNLDINESQGDGPGLHDTIWRQRR